MKLGARAVKGKVIVLKLLIDELISDSIWLGAATETGSEMEISKADRAVRKSRRKLEGMIGVHEKTNVFQRRNKGHVEAVP